MICRIICFVACFPAFLFASDNEASTLLNLTFDSELPGERVGSVSVSAGSLITPRYPDFPESNNVLKLDSPSYLRIKDSAERSFDFDNGDAVTFEAWIRLDKVGENIAIISKGRTGTGGYKAINQNWAFRLRKNSGLACPNFLFRSRDAEGHKGDWHRWTANDGFGSGPRWHHVALTYKFGDPKSIRAFVDGKEVKGKWDMGGATEHPPVVDDDDVLIGSTMNGNPGNSFDGSMDNLAVYRDILPAEELMARYRRTPVEVKPPEVTPGRVTVELFGPIDSFKAFPEETDPAVLQWEQSTLAFNRMPNRYDEWGVRDDWGATMLVRAWTDIELPAGDHKLLLRSRGMSQLRIDDKVLTTTPVQKNRSGAHHVVDPLPAVPVEGMRPAAMNDSEKLITFHSDGGKHRIRWDMIVGGPSYRLEFGEATLAMQSDDGMFHMISHEKTYPLTDDGWKAFVADHIQSVTAFDRRRRVAANANLADYWAARHEHARDTLRNSTDPGSLDDVIRQRLEEVNAEAKAKQASAASSTKDDPYFAEHIQPIFDAHCVRCHGEKEQGGLLIGSRERLLAGGESGQAAIVPGKPHESYLFDLVSADADDYRMPPKGDGLSQDEIAKVRQWIAQGAAMPSRAPEIVQQPAVVDDDTFLRRVFIDTVGVPPTIREVDQFYSDAAEVRRSNVIDRLLKDDRWADNWVGYWQDVLAENPNLLKPTLNNTGPFRFWIHEALTDNKAVDRFATELILMRGSKWDGGSAGFEVASQNDVPMAAKANVLSAAFLGVNLKCARCHDAPYHQWKQQDLFEMAAMLGRKTLKLPSSSTVPAAFFEKQERKSLIEVSLKPNSPVDAHFPFAELSGVVHESLLVKPGDTREQLALRITGSRRFAEVVANRIWKQLMGAGIVDPVDDWEGNPPSDARLLSHLADVLINVDYDLRELSRHIFESKVYQRHAGDLPARHDRHFAGPYRRRMTAEQIVDSAFHVVGQQMQTEMLTLDVEGTLPASRFLNFWFPKRSWEFSTLANERDRPSLALPKAQAIIDVLKAFGWRNSRPEPLTERDHAPNLIQPGVLANGSLGLWLTRLTDDSELTTTALTAKSPAEFVDALFLRFLTRKPTSAERQEYLALLSQGFEQRKVPSGELPEPAASERHRYVSWSNHLNSEANVIKVQMQDELRRGPAPTRFLTTEWRERAEDAVWSLLNSPEMILVP